MGWLVLSGAEPDLTLNPELLDRILEHVSPGRGVLSIEMSADLPSSDDLANEVALLMGDTCTRMLLEPNHIDAIRQAWLESGFIFTRGGSEPDWRAWVDDYLFQGYPEEILANGSVLFASGPCAGALGSWIGAGWRVGEPGLGWLEGGIILPDVDQPVDHPAVVELLEMDDPRYALGLNKASALALGPKGEREIWGEQAPVIVLGRGWYAQP
jgi:hypothetical protein